MPIRTRIRIPCAVRDTHNRQKRSLLKQDNLLGLNHTSQMIQIPLYHIQVWNQAVDNIPPRLVQTLIPYCRRKAPYTPLKLPTPSDDHPFSFFKEGAAEIGLHEIHFVD